MTSSDPIRLARDCDAVLIPSGAPTRLPAGTPVVITQALGGGYTVDAQGQLARIDERDAPALGLEPPPSPAPPADAATSPNSTLEAMIWKQLRRCYDPEIPVNIVELGLVYDLQLAPRPEGGQRADIKMTLTAPGCGMGPMIMEDVRQKVLGVPGVAEANVEMAWDPPWNQAMMTEAARLQLGLM